MHVTSCICRAFITYNMVGRIETEEGIFIISGRCYAQINSINNKLVEFNSKQFIIVTAIQEDS